MKTTNYTLMTEDQIKAVSKGLTNMSITISKKTDYKRVENPYKGKNLKP